MKGSAETELLQCAVLFLQRATYSLKQVHNIWLLVVLVWYSTTLKLHESSVFRGRHCSLLMLHLMVGVDKSAGALPVLYTWPSQHCCLKKHTEPAIILFGPKEPLICTTTRYSIRRNSCSKLLQLSICNGIAQLKLPENSFQTSRSICRGKEKCSCSKLIMAHQLTLTWTSWSSPSYWIKKQRVLLDELHRIPSQIR
jgi:hypothetical protein